METFVLSLIGASIAIFAIVKIVDLISTIVEVPAFFKAAVFVNGEPMKILETGRYRLWTKNVQTEVFDPRDQWIQVSGQELLTKDGAPVRVSVAVLRTMIDEAKFASAGDVYSQVYVMAQLAVREHVVTRTLDELMEQRREIDEALKREVHQQVEALGAGIAYLAIRDITLIGDTKRAYAEVIQAQLRAKAKLEQARGEAAAMRSLLNTAELVKKHPELIHLRALQQLESGANGVQLNLTLGAATGPGESAQSATSA